MEYQFLFSLLWGGQDDFILSFLEEKKQSRDIPDSSLWVEIKMM